MDILTHLATTLPHWPNNCTHAEPLGNNVLRWRVANDNQLIPIDSIFRFDYEAKRKELQNKPDWSEAPVWANWLAQNNDGEWYWYSARPIINYDYGCWVAAPYSISGSDKMIIGQVLNDFSDTLEAKP